MCKVLDTAHRGVGTQQRGVVAIDQNSCFFDITWKEVSKPHSLETGLSIFVVSPNSVGVTVETVNGDDAARLVISTFTKGYECMLDGVVAKPYSSIGSSGAARTVRPMNPRSMLTLRPASTLPFKFKAFFALDWDWKVTVATSEESLADPCEQRDIFDVALTFWRSRKL